MGINKIIKEVAAFTMLSMAYSNGGGIYGIPRGKRVDRNNYRANIKEDRELREYTIKGQKVMAYSKKMLLKD